MGPLTVRYNTGTAAASDYLTTSDGTSYFWDVSPKYTPIGPQIAEITALARLWAKYLLSIAHPPLEYPKSPRKADIRPKNSKIWLWNRFRCLSPPFSHYFGSFGFISRPNDLEVPPFPILLAKRP